MEDQSIAEPGSSVKYLGSEWLRDAREQSIDESWGGGALGTMVEDA